MPFTRIKFNNSATDFGAYVLPLNPSQMDIGDETIYSKKVSLDGTVVIQKPYTYPNQVTLSWTNIPKNLSGFTTMVTTLKGYKQQFKYMNLASVDYASYGWRYYVVEDVKTTVNRGGDLKINLEVLLTPVV